MTDAAPINGTAKTRAALARHFMDISDDRFWRSNPIGFYTWVAWRSLPRRGPFGVKNDLPSRPSEAERNGEKNNSPRTCCRGLLQSTWAANLRCGLDLQ